MKYSTIFLDFDDTLIDTDGNAKRCMQEVYQENNIQQYYPTFEEFFEIYHANNTRLWSEYALGKIDKPTLLNTRFVKPFQDFPEVSHEWQKQLSANFLNKIVMMDTYIDGAKDLLEYLKPRYKIVMLSNGFTELQYQKLESVGFTKYFDEVILSDIVGVNKPHPAIFSYALDKVQSVAEETIMIGDNIVADIEGAIKSNIDQIWYNPRMKTAELKPTYTITHLSQILEIL